jgi:hypothetical protein
VNRAELGALRDAIATILNWPDSVRDQIAQWLQTDAASPNGAGRGRSSLSLSLVLIGRVVRGRAYKKRRRASRHYLKRCVTIQRLASCSGRRQPAATRARYPCGSADWPSAASSSGTATVAGGSPWQTLRCRRHSDGGGGGRASGARRRRMHAVANSYRGVNFARRAVAGPARAVS